MNISRDEWALLIYHLYRTFLSKQSKVKQHIYISSVLEYNGDWTIPKAVDQWRDTINQIYMLTGLWLYRNAMPFFGLANLLTILLLQTKSNIHRIWRTIIY